MTKISSSLTKIYVSVPWYGGVSGTQILLQGETYHWVWPTVKAIYITSWLDPTQHPSGWSSIFSLLHSPARWMLIINVNLKTKISWCWILLKSGFQINPWKKLSSPLSPIKAPIGQSLSYKWHPLEFAGNVEKETLSSHLAVWCRLR